MGINNEYGYDAFNTEDAYDDDMMDDETLNLDPQSFHDWHSEHVLNMWMSLRQYLEDNHMSNKLMTQATFHKFAEFVRTNT